MARDRKIIKKEMTDAFVANPNIQSSYALTPGQTFEQEFSLVSLENILFEIISYVLWAHEVIVSTNAENSRPHNIPWYKEKCLGFLDGLPLVWSDGQFTYNLTGVTDAEDRKIIDRVAVLESNDGELVIKIATDNNGVIEPVTAPQLVRFTAYMQQIKDAGNIIRIINQPADLLKITLTVYVDPLIIDLDTGRLLTTDEDIYPVEDAVNGYLANLEFNGGFVREFFRDSLQKATGVKLPLINDVQWQYSSFSFVSIGDWKIPEAGYFKINSGDLIINYQAYELANT